MAVRDGTKTLTAREGTKARSSTLEATETMPEPRPQRRQPDARFRLQVDRQTKQSYATSELAEQAEQHLVARRPTHPGFLTNHGLEQSRGDPALTGHQRLEQLVPDGRRHQNEFRFGDSDLEDVQRGLVDFQLVAADSVPVLLKFLP